MRLSFLAILFLAIPVRAQGLDRALVVTRLASGPGGPVSQLLAVDLVSGAWQAYGRFGHDGLPPQAVAVDPVANDAILAVAFAGGARLVRLRRHGLSVVQETVLADLTTPAADVAIAHTGGVYVALGGAAGGVYVVPRNGGAPALVAAIPRASAFGNVALGSSYAWLVQAGDASVPADPASRILDFGNGQSGWVTVFTGHLPLGLTGIADLPTGLVRNVLTDESGQASLSVGFANPVPIPLTPVLPAGATRALAMRSAFEGVALGSVTHPFLKSFQALGGAQAWQLLSGPLPGDPVDFVLEGTATAGWDRFGTACGGSSPLTPAIDASGGLPQLGNAAFGVELRSGAPSAAALLVLGASDQSWLGLPLPLPLPGGCQLLVAAQVPLPGATNAQGSASQSLPIPNDPALVGAHAFVQWLQVTSTLQVLASAALALHLQ